MEISANLGIQKPALKCATFSLVTTLFLLLSEKLSLVSSETRKCNLAQIFIWSILIITSSLQIYPYLGLKFLANIARNASHFTAKRASSAFVTIERLSHKDQRPPRWSEVAAAMIFTGRPSQTQSRRSPWSCLLLLVDFFPFFFSWLLHDGSCSRFASGDHLIVYFLVCLCLCVWMVGMLRTWRSACRTIITTISIRRDFKLKMLEWPCG